MILAANDRPNDVRKIGFLIHHDIRLSHAMYAGSRSERDMVVNVQQ